MQWIWFRRQQKGFEILPLTLMRRPEGESVLHVTLKRIEFFAVTLSYSICLSFSLVVPIFLLHLGKFPCQSYVKAYIRYFWLFFCCQRIYSSSSDGRFRGESLVLSAFSVSSPSGALTSLLVLSSRALYFANIRNNNFQELSVAWRESAGRIKTIRKIERGMQH